MIEKDGQEIPMDEVPVSGLLIVLIKDVVETREISHKMNMLRAQMNKDPNVRLDVQAQNFLKEMAKRADHGRQGIAEVAQELERRFEDAGIETPSKSLLAPK